MSTDKMMDLCAEQTCLLVLNMSVLSQISNKHYPRIRVTDQKFYTKLEEMKKETNQLQNFDFGIYMDGKIALGYVQDIDELTMDEGELLNIEYSKNIVVKWWSLLGGAVGFIWGMRKMAQENNKPNLSILIGMYYLLELIPLYHRLTSV